MDKKYKVSLTCPACGLVRSVQKYTKRKSDMCGPCATRARSVKHGLEKHPLYNTWQNMKKRCSGRMDPAKNRHYVNVKICDEWNDVANFIAWAEASGWEKGLSIERVDIEAGYCPENCTWIPLKHQARNRRDNTMSPEIAKAIQAQVAAGRVRYHVAKEFAKKHGINLSTTTRVAYGYGWK